MMKKADRLRSQGKAAQADAMITEFEEKARKEREENLNNSLSEAPEEK